ncbi:MAG: VWA domain-containing protein [Acidobacteriota bacterium]|nr:VWA domain-containing protein [Acidobacteriota bacterium]
MKFAAAAALVLSLGLTAGAQFRSGIDLVTFVVVASDKQGLVGGLTKEDFQILEDGKPQTVQFFAQGDVTARMPLRLGLLFDTSGSMALDINFSRTAAIKFMNAVEHAKDVTLVDFDTEVRLARYGQDDYPQLFERIRRRKADGFTALYDAIGTYLNGMAMEDGQKVLLLYTDGGDSRSRMSFTQVLELLKFIDVTIYAIGFMDHQPSSTRMEQRMRLEQLAAATGGQAYFPGSRDQLDEMYGKILKELDGRYTLGYISANTSPTSSWRKVDIRLANPAVKGVKIRARNGYYSPGKPGS